MLSTSIGISIVLVGRRSAEILLSASAIVYDDYFDVIGSYRGHPIVEEICSTSAAQTWSALLYVCEFSNVEVILAENNAKVANWYKVYIREVRRILFSRSTFFGRPQLDGDSRRR
jgi:hypothetical protein